MAKLNFCCCFNTKTRGLITVFLSTLVLAFVLYFLDGLVDFMAAHNVKMACGAAFIAKRKPHIDNVTRSSIGSEPVFSELRAPVASLYSFTFFFDPANQVPHVTAYSKWFPHISRTAFFVNPLLGCVTAQRGSNSISADLTRAAHAFSVAEQTRQRSETIPKQLEFATSPSIQALANSDISNSNEISRAILVIHKQKVIAEAYAPGFSRSTPQLSWSMAKSLLNPLYGIMQHKGFIHVNETVVNQFSHVIPQVKEYWSKDDRKLITVDHLLRMSSGLYFDESYTSANSDVMRMLYHSTSVAEIALNRTLVEKPRDAAVNTSVVGHVFFYSSGTSNLLSYLLKTKFKTLVEYWQFYRRELLEKIGAFDADQHDSMSNNILEVDESGTQVLSSYAYLTPITWAKIGLLYLRDGVWPTQDGESVRILPRGWVQQHAEAAAPASHNMYTSHFWKPEFIYKFLATGTKRKLPEDTYFAFGAQGQYMFIVPSEELVIVRMGTTLNTFDVLGTWLNEEFVQRVIEKLHQ